MEALAHTIREFGIIESSPDREYVNRLTRSHTVRQAVKSGIYVCYGYSHRDPLPSGMIALFLGRTPTANPIEEDPSRWIQTNLPQLLAKYADEWIAVKDNLVVEHSRNLTVLVKRLAKEGIQDPFITQMTKAGKAKATVYSLDGD